MRIFIQWNLSVYFTLSVYRFSETINVNTCNDNKDGDNRQQPKLDGRQCAPLVIASIVF